MYDKKFPKSIMDAIAYYYANRGLHNEKKWDKKADLRLIMLRANILGYGMQASAGTFWFNKNNNLYTVNEAYFPNAKRVKLNFNLTFKA